MHDVMIIERANDGVVRHYRYCVHGGMLCRVNSAGDVVMRVCALPTGSAELSRLSDVQLVYLVVDWHGHNCSCPGARITWELCYN